MKRKNNASCKFRIGTNIRKWRNIKDVKQKDLAAALHISEAAVSNIENDITNITVAQLEEIAIALNLSMEQLLSDPQDKFRSQLFADHLSIEKEGQLSADKDFLHAVITSMEKKDQQLQVIMQHFINIMSQIMQQDTLIFNGSKRANSRA